LRQFVAVGGPALEPTVRRQILLEICDVAYNARASAGWKETVLPLLEAIVSSEMVPEHRQIFQHRVRTFVEEYV
jgi:hypothetical protein